MSSDLILKRLFAVSLVLLSLFVWSCEEDSSDVDSEPEIFMTLKYAKDEQLENDQSGQFKFSIDSFIKDEYLVLEGGQLVDVQLADFWAGLTVRWGLRQKTAAQHGEAKDTAAAAAESSSETSGGTPDILWLQRSANYRNDYTTRYRITVPEKEKQFFVLTPQNLKKYLSTAEFDIPFQQLELVAEVAPEGGVEGAFNTTASIELPSDFRITGKNTEPPVGLQPSKPITDSQPVKDTKGPSSGKDTDPPVGSQPSKPITDSQPAKDTKSAKNSGPSYAKPKISIFNEYANDAKESMISRRLMNLAFICFVSPPDNYSGKIQQKWEKSEDGGQTFELMKLEEGDYHRYQIDRFTGWNTGQSIMFRITPIINSGGIDIEGDPYLTQNYVIKD